MDFHGCLSLNDSFLWQDDDEGEIWCGNDHEATSAVFDLSFRPITTDKS